MDPFPAWGSWSARTFWSRIDVDAVFGVQGLHGSGQGNGMRFSLCTRIVLALKPDVEQFLMMQEAGMGTDCWSHGLHRNQSPRLPGTVHPLHTAPVAHLQPWCSLAPQRRCLGGQGRIVSPRGD